MGPAEPTHRPADQRPASERARPDAELADLQALGQLHVTLQVAGGKLERGGVTQDQLAEHGRGHVALAAVEEAGAEPGLQGLDAARQGGLRQVQ